MRKIVIPAALSATALLAACNGNNANNAAASVATTANGAIATPGPVTPGPGPAPAPTPAGGIDQAFMVGHWSTDAACAKTITFEADGVARVSEGPRPGRWSLAGDTLTVTPPDSQPRPVRIARDGDALVATGDNGRTDRLVRCQAAAPTEKEG